MAEVYEVGRKAFDWLVGTGRLHDECRGHGDYVVVSCLANPILSLGRDFCAVEYFESEYWAARRAEGCESVSLGNQRYVDFWYPLHAYEVWHVVDDDATMEPVTYEVLRFERDCNEWMASTDTYLDAVRLAKRFAKREGGFYSIYVRMGDVMMFLSYWWIDCFGEVRYIHDNKSLAMVGIDRATR